MVYIPVPLPAVTQYSNTICNMKYALLNMGKRRIVAGIIR